MGAGNISSAKPRGSACGLPTARKVLASIPHDVRSGRKWEERVTIRRLLKANRLAGLQEVEQRLTRAYRDVLRSLHLVDRNDPIAEIVAKTVIEVGATGVREPSEISKIAVKRLAHLGRPRREARTGQEFFADF